MSPGASDVDSSLSERIKTLIAALKIFEHAAESFKTPSAEAQDGHSRFPLHFAMCSRMLTDDLEWYLKCDRQMLLEQPIDRVISLLAASILDKPRLDVHDKKHSDRYGHNSLTKLEVLLQQWTTEHHHKERQKLILSSIDFGVQGRRRDLLISMQACSDQISMLDANIPEFRQHLQTTRSSTVAESLNFQDGDAVGLIHDAFLRRLPCNCPEVHGVQARIALSTYKRSLSKAQSLEYDIILGLVGSEDEWKETLVRVKGFESNKNHLEVSSYPSSRFNTSSDPNNDRVSRQLIQRICKSIRSSLSNSFRRLSLELDNDQLFKLQSTKTTHFNSDRLCQPITLAKLIRFRDHDIGEKVKRILAVVLGYSAFHLHGGPWLAASWHKSDIVFLASKSSIPLRPFLCRKLTSEAHGKSVASEIEADSSEIDPDDSPLHPFPELVSLGVLLMEIYFTCAIEDLAERHNIELTDDTNTNFCAVMELFEKIGSNMSDRYRAAIDACLDPNIGAEFNHEQQEPRANSIRSMIFKKIVSPLEEELMTGFGSSFSMQDIDTVAMNTDISRILSDDRQCFDTPSTTTASLLSQSLDLRKDQDVVRDKVFHLENVIPVTSDSEVRHITQVKTADCKTNSSPPQTKEEFRVAVICVLQTEIDAIHAVMDDFWEWDYLRTSRAPGDDNTYDYGSIGGHNIVLAYMPGKGNVHASSVATNLRNSFPNTALAMIVGVCGGVPSPADGAEVHLGDLIISTSVVKYDLGREYPNAFVQKDTSEDQLGRPSQRIRKNLARWNSRHYRQKIEQDIVGTMIQIQKQTPEIYRPGDEADHLYQSAYVHRHRQPHPDCSPGYCDSDNSYACKVATQTSCEKLGCDFGKIVQRNRKRSQPVVHFGAIGSGDTVMKSGVRRDQLAGKHGLVAFEMEGAGTWDQLPCIIVKSVCDYADSHKSKQWQNYASAVAAAGMKALLKLWTN